jgi:lipoprotein-anchoring transpeptidase ErfK/SrfK
MKTTHRLLLVTDILLFILIVLFSIFGYKKTLQKEVEASSNPSSNVLGVSDQKEEKGIKDISVCITYDCLPIKYSAEYEDVSKLNMYVTENVVPFLEDLAGGKTYTINRNGKFEHWKNDSVPDTRGLTEKIDVAFRNGLEIVSVELLNSPSTNGQYSARYIEIDNSRQRLYAWYDGVVLKAIDLSAARNDYVVYGVFNIVDKGINPQAPSGRYMPYWMAFYYSKPQESWYGLHGLVWWYDENGRAIYEPEGNIGIRRSNGCIRMVKDDAKYLYDIYERGDPVLIHE